MTKPHRAVEAFGDEICEAVAVADLKLEMRVTASHIREDGRKVGRAKGERRGDP